MVSSPGRRSGRLVAAAVASVLLAVCASAGAAQPSARTLRVVAAENFWGSLASQLGGTHAAVQSVVTNPNADPHEYETNTNDARAFADADLVILNGAGYDAWGKKLLDANPSKSRQVLVVADLLGKHEGDNPHFWYDPAAVTRVVDQISAMYQAIDLADAASFAQQKDALTAALKPYYARIGEIKQKFAGVKVGATENIFAYLAQALGLNLISPPEFMQAVAEGTDPPAESVAAFQDQVTHKQISVLVYNVQTSTLVTTNIRKQAAGQEIPVVGVSETLQPESATFQEWQVSQLLTLENALNAHALSH
jgi:zinc/manganese transport system substrate-binding protein